MSTKAKENTASTAVRTYLEALQNPELLRDDAAIAAMQAKIEASTDVLEQIQLHTQLQELRRTSVKGSAVEAGFLKHAKEWADANGVDPRSFREVNNVPTTILTAAGFPVSRRKSTTRVNQAAVVAKLAEMEDEFTVKQLVEASGCSTITARAVLETGQENGSVTNLGADPDHEGKGAAPHRYTFKA